MNRAVLQLAIGIGCTTLLGCATRRLDPAGEARTRNAVTDIEISGLREPISLAEFERILGPGEGQPGPRMTYRSADHAKQFFWVYYFCPQNIPEPGRDAIMIHHIVRADRIEEGAGVVVWPPRWAGRPVTDASLDLGKLHEQSKAAPE